MSGLKKEEVRGDNNVEELVERISQNIAMCERPRKVAITCGPIVTVD